MNKIIYHNLLKLAESPLAIEKLNEYLGCPAILMQENVAFWKQLEDFCTTFERVYGKNVIYWSQMRHHLDSALTGYVDFSE